MISLLVIIKFYSYKFSYQITNYEYIIHPYNSMRLCTFITHTTSIIVICTHTVYIIVAILNRYSREVSLLQLLFGVSSQSNFSICTAAGPLIHNIACSMITPRGTGYQNYGTERRFHSPFSTREIFNQNKVC